MIDGTRAALTVSPPRTSRQSKQMDIWLVHIGEPLPGGGTEMHAAALARALAARGHRVLWWVSAFDHFRKQWLFEADKKFAISDGLTGYAIRGCGYSTNTSPRRLVDHRIVARRWRRLAAAEPQPSVVVAVMPPHDLAYEAVRFAADRGIPSVLNLRDPWPDAILDLAPRQLRPLARRLLWYDFRMLRGSVRHTDSLVGVTRSILEWGRAYAGRAPNADDRVIYTGARHLEGGAASPQMQSFLTSLTNQFVVAFVGTFGFYHLPTLAIDAARRLAQSNIHFVLAGSGDGEGSLRAKAVGLPNVHFPGWLSDADSAELLRRAKIGICSATRPLAILPNKAAAYFRAGLPVISSFDGDLRQLINERRAGFNHSPGDADAFVEFIVRLAGDENLRRSMAGNASSLYRECFDADANIASFSDHIESVAAKRATSGPSALKRR